MAALKAQPIGARKLTRDMRYRMAKFARDKFRSPELREIEAKARQTIIDLFIRDALTIPKSEIEALERYGFARVIDGLSLPYDIEVTEKSDRTFQKPNGEVVTRSTGKGRTIMAPSRDEDRDLPRFNSWNQALAIQPERLKDHGMKLSLRFGRPVTLPSDTSGNFLTVTWAPTARPGITLSSTSTVFLTPDVAPAIAAFYVAADARILAERRLICTAIKIIDGCSTYGQVLDAWPEVAEIQETLFEPSVLPNAFSVVALSDEDKAALCANMASRGVSGGLCSRQVA